MRYLLIIFSFMLSLGISHAQKNNPNFDSTLAKKYGADDYGMKTYTMVVLKQGQTKQLIKLSLIAVLRYT